ncbi:DUF1643 domain-containing protein [Priestia filamentosa]|uniref:DUF1643 domain-containing protein n=1 Tax=Priestia filamentosa TaxID=1402861 RepID=UPI0002E3B290|nr:DUF1643 domain-containing protein [Priestia filamentosa]
MKREAIFDETGTYRYSLKRKWGNDRERKVAFITLYPDNADEIREDYVTSKCITFAKKWGFNAVECLNLFSYRAQKADDLSDLDKEDAIGAETDRYLYYGTRNADLVIAAWGKNVFHDRENDIKQLFEGMDLACFSGQENHPSQLQFISYDTRLMPFELEAEEPYLFSDFPSLYR